jgi:hypothetical protein
MVVRLSGLRYRYLLPPRKIPGTHFCQRLSQSQDHCVAGWIRLIEKSSDLIGSQTRDLPACGIILPRDLLSCVVWVLRASQLNAKKERNEATHLQ